MDDVAVIAALIDAAPLRAGAGGACTAGAGRLPARQLNHGTIASPLPNQESSIVLNKIRAWRRQAPEITVGDGSNPTIAVRLADVDCQSVLEKVRTVDTEGARRMLLKQIVWDSAGINYDPSTFTVQRHRMVWRGRSAPWNWSSARSTA